MPSMPVRMFAFAIGVILALAEMGLCDTLITARGTKYEGTVTETADGESYILVKQNGGKMTFPKAMVAGVQRSKSRPDGNAGKSTAAKPSPILTKPPRSATAKGSASTIVVVTSGTGTKDQVTVVVVTGVGVTGDSALRNALSNAVQAAVGLVVDAETIVKNDKIIREQVIMYSNAYVRKYEELHRKKTQEGLIAIRIKATVQKKKLLEKLTAANVISAEVRGKDLFAQVITQLKEEKDAALIIKKVFENFPGNVLKAAPVGRPRIISKSESEVLLGVTVGFSVDLAKYSRWVEAFKPYLGKVALKTLPLRWNPEQVGLKTLGKSWQKLDVRRKGDYRGNVSIPKAQRRNCLVPSLNNVIDWFPKSLKGAKAFAVVDRQGSSRATVYVLNKEAFSMVVNSSLAIPLVSIVLKDANGKEVDGQDHTGFTKGGLITWYASPFWAFRGLSHGTLNPVPEIGYRFHFGKLNSEMIPPGLRSLQNEYRLILIPYLGANRGTNNSVLLSSFCREYVFKLTPKQLLRMAKVEVSISSRNNLNATNDQAK
jgi:hypothetical protein